MSLKKKIQELRNGIAKYEKNKGAESNVVKVVRTWKSKNEAFLKRVEKITVRIKRRMRMDVKKKLIFRKEIKPISKESKSKERLKNLSFLWQKRSIRKSINFKSSPLKRRQS